MIIHYPFLIIGVCDIFTCIIYFACCKINGDKSKLGLWLSVVDLILGLVLVYFAFNWFMAV